MRWFGLAVVWVAAVFVGACGGEPATEAASEEPAKVEEVAKEKEQSSDDTASLDCQLSQAEADLGVAGAEGLVAEWHAQEVEPRLEEDLSSALPEAKDLRTFLAERGYVC
ncbi:MAG: hypothetical protein M3N18_01520 [Actinomycetota bacterium]|nr:hypothetical protein [Actinomycetota bacterium]